LICPRSNTGQILPNPEPETGLFQRVLKGTPNNVSGGGGLAAEAQLLTVARLEAGYIGENRGCSEIFLCRFRD
jgi:hypothetical protein